MKPRSARRARSRSRKPTIATWRCSSRSASTSAIRSPTSAPPRPARAASAAAKPTFGECADHHIAAHAASWRNPKNAQQWRMTLTTYCAPIRVDAGRQGRHRSRAERPQAAVDASAGNRVAPQRPDRSGAGFGSGRRPHPPRPDQPGALARLARPQAAEPEEDRRTRPLRGAILTPIVPEFMARLVATPGTAAKALAFIILTAARSGEALGMTWDEVDLDTAIWTIPASRMKAGKAHVVPLSDQALSILRGQMAARGKNPHVFPSHLPRQALSSASLALVMQRLGTNATTHGMRASVSHVGRRSGRRLRGRRSNALPTRSAQPWCKRTSAASMLDRRRPVMDGVGVVRHANGQGRQGGADHRAPPLRLSR